MTVHILLLRDQYDSDVVGVFLDPEMGKATGDRLFPPPAASPGPPTVGADSSATSAPAAAPTSG